MSGKACSLFAFVWGFAAVGLAGAPGEATVHGLYEGACRDGKGERKLEVRVVACGKGTYKVYVRQDLGGGKIAKVELDGKTKGEAVIFKGKAGNVQWTCSYAGGTIKGSCGEGCSLEIKRVERKSPTLGKKPPEGAIVLLDGKSFSEMVKHDAGD